MGHSSVAESLPGKPADPLPLIGAPPSGGGEDAGHAIAGPTGASSGDRRGARAGEQWPFGRDYYDHASA